MGKIVIIFLCVFAAVVCGKSVKNLKSSAAENEVSKGFFKRVEELEKFHEEFKTFKLSFIELTSAFRQFHQSVAKNQSGTGSTGEKSPDLQPKPLTSCSDALEFVPSPRSQKQTIYPHENDTKIEVLCDFETDGGGWTVIQKRTSGPQQEFNQTWTEYQNGFGSVSGNFWLGLENIHALTQNGDQELRIDLEDFQGNKTFATYSNFAISDASDFYRLSIGGFSENSNSTAGDSMTGEYSNDGMRFTTKDVDHDNWVGVNCAADRGGGWWFNHCGRSLLNGLYFEKGENVPHAKGLIWWSWTRWDSILAKTEMKIRKRKSEFESESEFELP